MAYPPNLSGRHGGGFDPSSGTFVQVPSYQQSYPTQPHHCGGGSYDPNNPTLKPAVVVHHQPVSRLQPTFAPQAPVTYYHQPYQQYQQPPLHKSNQQSGLLARLCACFT